MGAASQWTPVNESADLASKWTPVQESKQQSAPQDKSTLGKLWDWANRGIISKDTIVGAMTGMTPEELNKELSEIPNESPAHAGIREFIRGSIQDTAGTASGFTSPLAVGTAGLGAAGKIPGAVGTIAKVGTGLVGAGFAAKGTGDVANAISNNDSKPFADRVQQGLQGGAMVAGGSAGAGAAVKGLAASASGKAEGLYKSALKPSVNAKDVPRAINTALEEGIPVSKGGLEKLSDLKDALDQKLSNAIAGGQGKTINKFAVTSRLGDTAQNLSEQVAPRADLEAIGKVGNEFLEDRPNEIPAAEAQRMKVGTYKALRNSYGQQQAGAVEAQKALARGIKEELETQFPELQQTNARYGNLLSLEPLLEKAVARIGNHQMMGIGTPITAGAAKAVTGSAPVAAVAAILKAVVDDPFVKSRMAISLNKSGVTLPDAYSRLGAYSNALAAASSSASNDTQQRHNAQ